MNKQEQINAWDKRPITEGDSVNVVLNYKEKQIVTTGRGKNKKNETIFVDKTWSNGGEVKEIFNLESGKLFAISFVSKHPPIETKISMGDYNPPYGSYLIKESDVYRTYGHCGSNPFKSEPPRVNFYNKQIDSILADCGYGRRSDSYQKMDITTITDRGHDNEKHLIGKTYGGCNFDPYVIDKNGNRQYFQRGLVWTLEQKQNLIESIYNWIEIGKIVFRYKDWDSLAKEMSEDGHGYNWECIDGKQRINAILDFVQGKYPDLHGNYWDDLSPAAQRRILNYDRVAFAKLEEKTSDADVIRVFLTLNFTGVPMSLDHIKFVQSINV